MENEMMKDMIENVINGEMSRRKFIETAVLAGVSASMAARMLTSADVSEASEAGDVSKPKSSWPGHMDIKPLDPDFFIHGRLKGKTLIVTGGARGIGKAAAIRASREGAQVVIADWLTKEGQETTAIINSEGAKAVFIKTDVRNSSDCDRMVADAVGNFGGLHYAINSAGIMSAMHSNEEFNFEKNKGRWPSRVHEATDEYWQMLMDVNATGVFKSMRAELGQMVKQGKGGAIVNIGSIAGMTGLGGNSAYVASKHAVTGLTKQAAIDYSPYGIRINSVNMAATDTPMTELAFKFVTAQMRAQTEAGKVEPNLAMLKTQSLLMAADSSHRQATVWEQASAILFLLSDEASNLTGAIYATDGGWTAF